ncbi:MAG: hypothetical protein ACD_36C00013G0003 [uncultured bacterium]|uniref:Uncharacterized protein n=1 Tax=Candidatus Gottesmanbacteria bacterium RIFCSPLOWO2_01_FULL_43_11b TaxID=1798392 RepID=A0A1F6AI56_9BACT|nr:MAG: hypothetical protein ACD_36C00013G0003 [uncultured bacterium]OGG24385.1 MAG: hypothetical protein A3A79_04340 [Candidatus Gottesmanbacteria bacterium RIFCSPLOWO2_01_FULL_43_11b]
MILQFLVALVGSGLVLSTVSLVWPKFTDQPRPPQLEKVREVVMQTPLGQQAAAYLEPINVSSVAGTLAEKAGSAVTEKVTQEVTSRAVSQIISQIDTLPQDQRTLLEEAICKKNE